MQVVECSSHHDGSSTTTVRRLLEAKADINATDWDGNTLLSSTTETVKQLQGGANQRNETVVAHERLLEVALAFLERKVLYVGCSR